MRRTGLSVLPTWCAEPGFGPDDEVVVEVLLEGPQVHHNRSRRSPGVSGRADRGAILQFDADFLLQLRRSLDRGAIRPENARQADQRRRGSSQDQVTRSLTLPYPASKARAKSSEGPAWPADSSAVWVRAKARWAAS